MPCRIIHDEQGNAIGHACVRGYRPGPCPICRNQPVTKLCDFPVGKGKTCDAKMCDRCATQVSIAVEAGKVGLVDTVDYCPKHKGQTAPQRGLFE